MLGVLIVILPRTCTCPDEHLRVVALLQDVHFSDAGARIVRVSSVRVANSILCLTELALHSSLLLLIRPRSNVVVPSLYGLDRVQVLLGRQDRPGDSLLL